MGAGAATELGEAPGKMAAKCFAREQTACLAPKVPAETRIIKIPPSRVEEHVSKKTKTFLFSPSFLNAVHVNPGSRLENEFHEILVTACYDKSLPAVPDFCPVEFLQLS